MTRTMDDSKRRMTRVRAASLRATYPESPTGLTPLSRRRLDCHLVKFRVQCFAVVIHTHHTIKDIVQYLADVLFKSSHKP
jgi:hypothetical protein